MIITIDGNIGSGKSSILTYLHKHYKIPIDLEPIEKWEPFLNKIYKEKTGFFNFQIRIWRDRAWIQEKEESSSIVIERSPYFIKNVFIKYLYNLKLITSNEYENLMSLHKITENLWSDNVYIYLSSNYKNCHTRIKTRGRECEKNIEEDYLKSLHDLHEETYLMSLKSKLNIYMINVENKSVQQIAEEIYNIIK